ncbi:hypothetical protein IAT40_003068 [Kwoniella sp. CBS 6097]
MADGDRPTSQASDAFSMKTLNEREENHGAKSPEAADHQDERQDTVEQLDGADGEAVPPHSDFRQVNGGSSEDVKVAGGDVEVVQKPQERIETEAPEAVTDEVNEVSPGDIDAKEMDPHQQQGADGQEVNAVSAESEQHESSNGGNEKTPATATDKEGSQQESKLVEGVKQAAGGVKKVLKSGVFGSGSPKPTPKSAPTPATSSIRTATTARQSLASRPTPCPLRTSTTTRPTASTTAKTPTSATSAGRTPIASSTTRPTHASRPSQSTSALRSSATRPTASSTTKTEVRSTSAAARPRAATGASDKTTASSSAAAARVTRPTATTAAASGSTVKPRISMKPPVTTGAFTTTSRTARPSAATSARPDTSRPGLTSSTTKSSAAGPADGSSKPRTTLSSSTSRLTRPLAGRASMAPTTSRTPATTAPAGVAQKTRTGSGPSVLVSGPSAAKANVNAKELAEVKSRLEEVEKNALDEKAAHDARLSELNEEKVWLEENHAKAIEELRAELSSAHNRAASDTETHIARLQELHEAEIRAANEKREIIENELAGKVEALAAEKATLENILASVQAELSSSQNTLSDVTSSLSAVQEELSTLKSSHNERSTVISSLEEAKTTLETKVSELEGVRTKLEAEIAEGAEEAEKSLVGVNDLEGQVKALQEEIEELQGQIEKEREGRKDEELKWSEEREALNVQLENHRVAGSGHTEALSAAKGEADAKQEELQQLKQAHDELSATYADLLRSSSKHPDQLAELEGKLKGAADKHVNLLEEVSQASNGKIKDLEDGLNAALKAKDEIQAELEEVKSKLVESEEELAQIAQVRQAMEEKEATLNEIIAKLEAEKEQSQAEFEARYSKAFDDAKISASEEHQSVLASIRSGIAETQSKLTEAHQAELESLRASHAMALSDLSADYLKSKQAVEDELINAKTQLETGKIAFAELEETNKNLKNEVGRLIGEMEKLANAAADKGPASDEVEAELKRVKGELQGVRDELDGAKEMAEMNKSHFEASLAAVQEQHSTELRAIADNRAKEDGTVEEKYRKDVLELQGALSKAHAELQDERVEKNSALARLAAQIQTPPTSPPPAEPRSPALTKLHEAHNAKVIELEK